MSIGWPIRLFLKFCKHQNKGCVLVNRLEAKFQQNLSKNTWGRNCCCCIGGCGWGIGWFGCGIGCPFPPPPPKVQAIAAKPKEKQKEKTRAELQAEEMAAFKQQTKNQVSLLVIGGALTLGLGLIAPVSFMQHFIVFVLSVFVGFQVIWNVSHSLHTPLMAVTNAISSIIILGALMQIGSGSYLVVILAAPSVFMAGINIFGACMVTRRMLASFHES